MKTNIEGQLDFLISRRDQDARYRPVVRMIKAWRNHHELEISSFGIELLSAHILDAQGTAASLEEGVLRFFLFVAQTSLQQKISFPENGVVSSWPADPVVILDPVNVTNNVTRRMTEGERREIVAKATEGWERLWTASENNFKTETIEHWKHVFGRSFRVE